MWIKSKIHWPAAIVLLSAWWLACWFATGAWFDGEAKDVYHTESLAAERFVANAVKGFDSIVASRVGLPRLLARDPALRQALAFMDPPTASAPPPYEERKRRWTEAPPLAATNLHLKTDADDLGHGVIGVFDLFGNCIAASNAGTDKSFVGINYADRDYFPDALAGRSGYRLTIGKQYGSSGIVFYAPVIDRGHPIGVVFNRIDLLPYVSWLASANAFITDRNGVVMLSSDPALAMHATADAPVRKLDPTKVQAIYRRAGIGLLDLVPVGDKRFPELRQVPGHIVPVILRSHSVEGGELTVNVLWPMPQLVVLPRQRVIYAGALCSIGTLMLLLLTGYGIRRREQSVMRLVLAEREQRLTDSRNFLDQVVNAIADPIFVKDREHRWVLVNQSFCNIFGQPREHFIGKSAHDVFPEREARRLHDIDERVLTACIESINEEKLIDGQGITHIVVTKNAPYTNANAQRFIVGTISDITERKQMERQLRAREQEFRSLAENLPVAVIRYDSGYRCRYLNRAAERMLHGIADELLGQVPDGDNVPATPAMIEHYRDKMEEVLATDTAQELDFVLDALPANQLERYEVLFVPERSADGKPIGVLAIWYDITERKQMELSLKESEARYRDNSNLLKSIFESPSGIYIYALDRDYRYLAYNSKFREAAKRAWGADIVVGMSMLEAIDTVAHREFCHKGFEQVLAGRSFTLESKESVVRDGVTIYEYHDNYGSQIRNDQGEIVGLTIFAVNITKRKRLEAELVEREQEFRTLVETAPEPILRYAPDGRRIYVNAAVERIGGISASVLLGGQSSDGKIASLRDGAAMVALVRRICETGESGEIEVEVVDSEGCRRYFHNRLAPEFGVDGKVRSVFSICHDITGRKLAEHSLTEARNRLLSVLHTMPDLVWLKDPQGIYLACNPMFERFFGAAEAQIVGKTDYDFVDAGLADFFREKDRQAMAAGRVCINDEEVVFADDGHKAVLETRKVPMYDADGKIIGVLGIGRDITQHKRLQDKIIQRESEFRTLIENSPDTVVRFDRQCRHIYCNPAILKLTGHCLADMLNKTIIDSSTYPLEFSSALTVLVQKVMDTGQPDDMELYWEKMATPVFLQFRVIPEFDQTGQVVSALSIGRDVTALKLAQERLRKSHDVLRALAAHQETEHEKERQDLAYQIHEDLAQNLAALRINISLLEMSGEPAKHAHLLKTMHDIADRSIVRIRDIVSMLRPTVLDLGLVPALHWLTDDFKGVGLKFDLALQEDIPLSNEVSSFLYRAAQEALLNIALHAGATHVQVLFDSVAGNCRLVVRDNGRGFDPTSPYREGCFGLIGLTEQARHLGGCLFIDSSFDQGAALEFTIPVFPKNRR